MEIDNILAKKKILDSIREYIDNKQSKETWTPGEDWVAYSGPTYTADEYMSAVDTLLSGWLIYGKKCREFEAEFAKYMGAKDGVLTNSGSSANLLMVSAFTSRKMKEKLRLRPGDKVITPVVCFPTTLNPVIQCGLEPVFVDVSLPDLNPDLDAVEKALENDPSIRGIMFAHVLGNPPDMDRLMALVEKYDLIFMEDTCDALGSTYDGKLLGSFGHLSTCSFFPAHHMTMGEGGYVATKTARMRNIVASFRDWGRACFCNSNKPGNVTAGTACGNRFQNWLPGYKSVTYDHRYVFDEIGYNIKPLELQAAIGLQQINKLDHLHAARRQNFQTLSEIFKPYEEYLHLPVATRKADPSWFAYMMTVKADAPFSRQEFVSHFEAAKIQTRSYFSGNILYHPGYGELAQEYDDLPERFPVAHLVTSNSVFVGTYAGVTDDKMRHVKNVTDEFFKKIK
tara:strand:+ start:3786 stop:5144 length:1359 start_codon:yes stop_codon:yes gene_type:complete